MYGILLLLLCLLLFPTRGSAGEPQFVIGDTLGGDPVLREAVIRWSAAHDGTFEIRAIAPEALGDPRNGCDAVLTDAGAEIRSGSGMILLPYAVEAVAAAGAQSNQIGRAHV